MSIDKPQENGHRQYRSSSSFEPAQDVYGSTETYTWAYRPEPPNPLKELIDIVKGALWSTGFISFICFLTLSVAILFAVTPGIQDWINTPSESSELPIEVLFLLIPLPVGFLELSGGAFQVWHLLILSILAVCFFYAVYSLFLSWRSKKKGAIESLVVPEKAKSGLEGVAKMFMAVSFFSLIYYLFLEAFGVSPNAPLFDEFSTNELLYELFSASVYEELISRLLLIGAPLLLIALMFRWKRPYFKFLLGGGMKLNVITLSLIILSALVFAIGHILAWDFWKVPQVLVSGMALGYVFVRFGIFASILLHFSVNFITSSTLEIWPGNFTVEIVISMVFLLWVFAGSYFFIDYSFKFAKKIGVILQEFSGVKPAPTMDSGYSRYPPQEKETELPYQQPPAHPIPPPPERYGPQSTHRGFACPFCGHVSAKYVDRRLICLRCGKAATQQEREEEKIDLTDEKI